MRLRKWNETVRVTDQFLVQTAQCRFERLLMSIVCSLGPEYAFIYLIPDSLSEIGEEILYIGEYSSPFYFRLFRPQCLRANKTRRILMCYTCITGPNRLQVKKSENKQGIQYIDSG